MSALVALSAYISSRSRCISLTPRRARLSSKCFHSALCLRENRKGDEQHGITGFYLPAFRRARRRNRENISPWSFSNEGEKTCVQPCFVEHSIFGLSRYPMQASLSQLTPSYVSLTLVFAALISGRIGDRVPIRQVGKSDMNGWAWLRRLVQRYAHSSAGTG